MSIRQILLFATAMLALTWGATDAAAKNDKKKKQQKKVVVVDDDLDTPQPDAPLMPLAPQMPLAPDQEGVKLQVLHTPNRQIMGIDVSHYQGSIDWREVARSGNVHYVYVKATEGADLVDNTLRTNLHGARRAGLKVGVYHFYIPNSSPQLQFQNLQQNVRLHDIDLIPIIDIERRGRDALPVFQRNLRNFIQMVERHYGVKPILYCSRDFYNKYLSGPFTNYKYMIARYHPDVPQLCDDAAFVMWQYSSTSYVRGIRGHVDRSCMMDNYTMRDILIR